MAADMDTAIALLRAAHRPPPRPSRLPTPAEVERLEGTLGLSFHDDLRRYFLEASDVCVGTLEPATITLEGSATQLTAVLESARAYGVPEELLPFCEDNADFFCLDEAGRVIYWSHNGVVDESWPDLATWINEVWLDDA